MPTLLAEDLDEGRGGENGGKNNDPPGVVLGSRCRQGRFPQEIAVFHKFSTSFPQGVVLLRFVIGARLCSEKCTASLAWRIMATLLAEESGFMPTRLAEELEDLGMVNQGVGDFMATLLAEELEDKAKMRAKIGTGHNVSLSTTWDGGRSQVEIAVVKMSVILWPWFLKCIGPKFLTRSSGGWHDDCAAAGWCGSITTPRPLAGAVRSP